MDNREIKKGLAAAGIGVILVFVSKEMDSNYLYALGLICVTVGIIKLVDGL